MSMEEIAKELTAAQKAKLAPKEFHMFSKAGIANVTPKGKKKNVAIPNQGQPTQAVDPEAAA